MRGFKYGSAKLRVRSSLLALGVGVMFAIPAAPAQACTPNAKGVAHSGGTAAESSATACPPAYGSSAGGDTGHKIG